MILCDGVKRLGLAGQRLTDCALLQRNVAGLGCSRFLGWTGEGPRRGVDERHDRPQVVWAAVKRNLGEQRQRPEVTAETIATSSIQIASASPFGF